MASEIIKVSMKPADEIVKQLLLQNDAFSKFLGIEVVALKTGYCKLQMKVRKEMLNGFYIAHGGIAYSLADSALAFASNSHGYKAVSVETSISHTKPLKENDVIYAEAIEQSRTSKIGIYHVNVYKAPENLLVALFKGTVYITAEAW